MSQTFEAARRRLQRVWLPLALACAIVYLSTYDLMNGATLVSAAGLIWVSVVSIGELKYLEGPAQ